MIITDQNIATIKHALARLGLGFNLYQDTQASEFALIVRGRDPTHIFASLVDGLKKIGASNSNPSQQLRIEQSGGVETLSTGRQDQDPQPRQVNDYTGFSQGYDPNPKLSLQEQIARAKLGAEEHNQASVNTKRRGWRKGLS